MILTKHTNIQKEHKVSSSFVKHVQIFRLQIKSKKFFTFLTLQRQMCMHIYLMTSNIVWCLEALKWTWVYCLFCWSKSSCLPDKQLFANIELRTSQFCSYKFEFNNKIIINNWGDTIINKPNKSEHKIKKKLWEIFIDWGSESSNMLWPVSTRWSKCASV